MTKRELAVLEKVFDAEIGAALTGSPPLFQTRSKVAVGLVEAGYLAFSEVTLGGRFPLKIAGYVLTEAGRAVYCESASASG